MGEDKMRIVVGDSSLNCNALEKPELINPAITCKTKGRNLQRLQEQQLGKLSDYLYQRVLYQVGRGIIVAFVPEQYIKPIYTQYVGYNGITILQFFAQLQKWFVILNRDKLKMREYFHAPWTDTPDAHASMYAAHLDERQIECRLRSGNLGRGGNNLLRWPDGEKRTLRVQVHRQLRRRGRQVVDHSRHHLRQTVRPRNAEYQTVGGEQGLRKYGSPKRGKPW